MTDTVTKHRGETIRLGIPVGLALTGAVLYDASIGQDFASPTISVVNAVSGQVEVLWSKAQTRVMRTGRVHQFLLGIDFPGGDTDFVGPIHLNIL